MNIRIKGTKKWLIAAAIAGILMVAASVFIPEGETEPESISYYSEVLEGKIKELLSNMDGIGEVSVMLTLDCSSEFVYAENTDSTEDRKVADYVVISGKDGENTVQLKEIYPRVRGVAVVCDGGDSTAVKAKITELLCSSLGIPSNRITVCG